jgi:hypothetical protein
MPTKIPTSVVEQLEDNIVAILEQTATEQAALDPNCIFYVGRDTLLSLDSESDQFPRAVVWLQSIVNEPSRSGGRTYLQETATFAIDCFAVGDQDNLDGGADVNSMKRLLYLIEQVRYGLFALVNVDLGLPAQCIARKNWPSFQMYQPDISTSESAVTSGRWTLPIEYGYSPEDIELMDLKIANVYTSDWDTIFNY